MESKINVVIFGLKYGMLGGMYNYDKKRKHLSTMGEAFEKLVNYIQHSDVAEEVNIFFIDLVEHDPGNASGEINYMLNMGCKLPFVMINDTMKFYGDIPKDAIYEEIKRNLEDGSNQVYS
jgi:hypothetical protein